MMAKNPIEWVLDILLLDDDVRNDLLQLSDEKMGDVAMFCNSYLSKFSPQPPERDTTTTRRKHKMGLVVAQWAIIG